MTTDKRDIVLKVEGLRTFISTERGLVRGVDGADLILHRGETLGLVGESGCGKTMAARSIMGLVKESPGVIEGRILFRVNGAAPIDLTEPLRAVSQDQMSVGGEVFVKKDMRRWNRAIQAIYQPLWGRHLSIIYQDPQTALNPYWAVGAQLGEAITIGHPDVAFTETQLKKRCIEWLDRVQINFPERVLETYPHELSGGMCQRIMIAIALASRPDLVIADEPTTGLDVTIQARIVDLFRDLREELDLTVLLVSHDMGLIRQLSDRVAVMYCGRIVECGSREEVLGDLSNRHPYTEALLSSMPTGSTMKRGARLPMIEDSVPDSMHPPSGCAFHPRCHVWKANANTAGPCDTERPATRYVSEDHWVRCWQCEDGTQ
jgi:oligopeptide/dipeptide ABC transporter ATP-binding protein